VGYRVLATVDEKTINEVKKRIGKALEIVGKFGNVVGFISRVEPAKVSEEERTITIEVPFKEYLESSLKGYCFPIGSFIGILNPLTSTVFLAKVVSVKRSDILAIAGIPTIHTPPSDITSLLTPLTIEVELLTEAKISDEGVIVETPIPAHSPIDPQSPVFKPNPDFIFEMLNLPKEGVDLGNLYVGGIVDENVNVKLPENVLYQHTLIVGTTGSGKTVLLKNTALSLIQNLQNKKPLIIAFDLQGDYMHLNIKNPRLEGEPVFQPVNTLTVILPVTKSFLESYVKPKLLEKLSSLKEVNIAGIVKLFYRTLIEEYFRNTYPEFKVRKAKIAFKLVDSKAYVYAITVEAEITVDNSKSECVVNIIPWSLNFRNIGYEVRNLLPIFSVQAYNLIPRVIDYIKSEYGELSIDEFTEKILDKTEVRGRLVYNLERDLGLHRETVNHLYRCFSILCQTEILDAKLEIEVNGGKYVIVFEESNYHKLFTETENILVIDLRFVGMFSKSQFTETVVVYRILDRLFAWKNEAFMKGVETRPVFIIIDEAHNYFPQARGEINKDVVERMVNKITRLGRVRGIGVFFATHIPSDLNDLIIQLTNTKIGLRSEEKVLERIGLKEYKKELELAPEGVGVVKSPALRTHYIMFKSYEPQTYHKTYG